MSKSLDELSLSTAIRKYKEHKFPWTRLFSLSTDRLCSEHVCDRVRSLYLLIQPILNEGSGFLRDEFGTLYTAETLAVKLHGRKVAQVRADLKKLTRLDALMERDGEYFCLMTVAAKNQNNSEILANLGKARIASDSQVTNSLENGLKSRDQVDKSRVEVNSGAPRGHPLFTDCTSGSAASETANQKSPGARGARSFSGLTETDAAAAAAQYPDVDPDITWDKFVRYHTNKGTAADKITRAALIGWFKREKPAKSRTTVTTTASTATTAPTVSTETAFMRDMPRVYQLTAEQKAKEAAEGCLYEVLGYEEASNWFYDHQKLNRDNPGHEDAFDRALAAAIKNGDVIITDSSGANVSTAPTGHPSCIWSKYRS